MERNIDVKEVSDGRFYLANDLVKADCGGCHGCSSCCRGMGSSVTLDPYDIFCLCRGLGECFEALMADRIELNIADRLILPNLKMAGEQEVCTFLNPEGRCSIHAFRPGMCRLFPLGRFYEDGDFRYFLQIHECPREPKAKIKVKRWLGIPELKRYEQFICDWHFYLKELRKKVEEAPELIREISLELLKRFYTEPYDLQGDFYGEFYQRLREG